jgi:hypothetical protein
MRAATNTRELRIHESKEYSYEYTRVGDARARGSEVWDCLFKNMCVCMALNRHSHRARPGGGRDSCYAAAAMYVSSCCRYICVLMLLPNMCPRSTRTATNETAAMLLRLCIYVCPHAAAIYVL